MGVTGLPPAKTLFAALSALRAASQKEVTLGAGCAIAGVIPRSAPTIGSTRSIPSLRIWFSISVRDR